MKEMKDGYKKRNKLKKNKKTKKTKRKHSFEPFQASSKRFHVLTHPTPH